MMQAGRLSTIIQILVILAAIGAASFYAMKNLDKVDPVVISDTLRFKDFSVPLTANAVGIAQKAGLGFVVEQVFGKDQKKAKLLAAQTEERVKDLSKDKQQAMEKYVAALKLVYDEQDQSAVAQALKVMEDTAGETIDPVFSYTWLGRSYVKNADNAGAVRAFRAAYQREPTNIDLEMNLARALMAVGQLDEAGKLVDQVLKQDPDHRMAKLSKAQLEKFKK